MQMGMDAYVLGLAVGLQARPPSGRTLWLSFEEDECRWVAYSSDRPETLQAVALRFDRVALCFTGTEQLIQPDGSYRWSEAIDDAVAVLSDARFR